MKDELIKLLKLESIDLNKELSFIHNDKDSLKVHVFLNDKFVSCPVCGSISIRKNGYRKKHITHSISTLEPCHIILYSKRFLCVDCRKSFIEENPFSYKFSKTSTLTVLLVLEDLKSHTSTFSSVAKSYNITSQTVANIFDYYIHSNRLTLPEILCIDEIYTKKMTKYKYSCVMINFLNRKLIDVLPSRHKLHLINYFSKIPVKERMNVKYVIIDMYLPYKEVAKSVFFNCKIAVDSFHVITHLNRAIDQIRLSIMKKFAKGKSPIKESNMYYYMLKKYHYFFKMNFDKIPDKEMKIYKIHSKWDKYSILKYLLDIDSDLKIAYNLRNRYYEFNKTATYENCDEELDDLISCFLKNKFTAFNEFGRLLLHWRQEIKNSFIVIDNRRLSNGPMEGVNSRLKCLIKNANGYSNFSRFRNRCIYTINKDVPISLYTNKTKK